MGASFGLGASDFELLKRSLKHPLIGLENIFL
jgi:hypothetical protein